MTYNEDMARREETLEEKLTALEETVARIKSLEPGLRRDLMEEAMELIQECQALIDREEPQD